MSEVGKVFSALSTEEWKRWSSAAEYSCSFVIVEIMSVCQVVLCP